MSLLHTGPAEGPPWDTALLRAAGHLALADRALRETSVELAGHAMSRVSTQEVEHLDDQAAIVGSCAGHIGAIYAVVHGASDAGWELNPP